MKRQLVVLAIVLAVCLCESNAASVVFNRDDILDKLDLELQNSLYKMGSRHGLRHCSCLPAPYCQQQPDGAGQIDIRIVTVPGNPPIGVTCGAGLVYCCHNETDTTVTTACGTRKLIPTPGVTLQSGQSQFGAYPWSALVLGIGNEYVGGGVLIDSMHILTAAHKVAGYANGVGLKVRLGEWNAGNDTEPYIYQEFAISRMAVHPHFDANNLHNDVAVITLATPVPISTSPHINAACLPPHGANFTGLKCWVSGWGKDAFGPDGKYQEIQKEVDVIILDKDECERKLRGTRLGRHFQFNKQSFICAGGEMSKDACTGDGGSPLVCELDGSFYVAGLVAWGIGCADVGIPGVYVNVDNFHVWIYKQLF